VPALPGRGDENKPGYSWGDESVVDALKKLIPFLFRSFCNWLIFKLKKNRRKVSQFEEFVSQFPSFPVSQFPSFPVSQFPRVALR